MEEIGPREPLQPYSLTSADKRDLKCKEGKKGANLLLDQICILDHFRAP